MQAASWIVADLDSGSVLAAKNAHGKFAPASALKTLTAITVVPHLDPKTTYVAQPADAAIDGTKVGLVPGSVYTVDDLVHGMMMSSGNDCANALATLFGGMARTTAAMNAKAAELGALDTHAVNDSGLDAPGQVSSVYDLSLFGRALLKDAYLTKIVQTKFYDFPAAGKSFGSDRERFQIQTHDKLLRNYEGATGVKNGYTVAARGSYIGTATRGGRSYVGTLINSPGNTWHESRDLLDWAFANGDVAAQGNLDDVRKSAAAAAAATKAAEAPAESQNLAGFALSPPQDTGGGWPWELAAGGAGGLLVAALVLAGLSRRPSLARGRRVR